MVNKERKGNIMGNLTNLTRRDIRGMTCEELKHTLNDTEVYRKVVLGDYDYIGAKELHTWLDNGIDYSEWTKEYIEYDFNNSEGYGLEFAYTTHNELYINKKLAKSLLMMDEGALGMLYRQFLIKTESEYMKLWEDAYNV